MALVAEVDTEEDLCHNLTQSTVTRVRGLTQGRHWQQPAVTRSSLHSTHIHSAPHSEHRGYPGPGAAPPSSCYGQQRRSRRRSRLRLRRSGRSVRQRAAAARRPVGRLRQPPGRAAPGKLLWAESCAGEGGVRGGVGRGDAGDVILSSSCGSWSAAAAAPELPAEL